MSLDFHPKKNDLFCSCDTNSEIRYWNIGQYSSTRVSKVTSDIFMIIIEDVMDLVDSQFLTSIT